MIDSKAIMSTDTIKTIESMINIATAYTKYRNIINKKCMDIADKDWSMKHISHQKKVMEEQKKEHVMY